ncbi:MAG: choice-of-anchor D domain-containing protein [Candidatus Acidiferrales bacterium]
MRAAAAKRGAPASSAAPHASGAYGNLPLSFEPNRGQTDARVKYLARGKGYTLFLTPTKEVLALRHTIPSPANPSSKLDPKVPAKYSRTVLEFELAGANQDAQISGAERQAGVTNYYLGNDPAKWRSGIPNYGRVLYRGAYPGVDIAYYGNQGELESDFILAPGADPSRIRMRVQGAKELQIAPSGDLMLSLESGSVKLQRPVAYQMIGGARREIRSGYELLAASEVGFTLGPYDHREKLIVDPTLAYSTYLGGSGNGSEYEGDGANTVVVDGAGEAYVTGYTSSSDFPTRNPAQGNLGEGEAVENAFVSKFAAGGASLVFSTYLGGSGIDGGNGIAIDSAGAAYVVGSTNSGNFPTQLPLPGQDSFSGGRCAFVSAFSSAGALTFSTYLCGGVNDYADGVAVDSSKDIYVTGITSSANFPTVNPVQASLAGTGNAFVTKLAAVTGNGSSLLFSTFFGGNGSDFSQSIALDGNSPPNIYIGGQTTSTVFPTKNPLQATNKTSAGNATGFVAELSVPAASAGAPSVVYATFLGGSYYDNVYGIAADAAGDAYVTGLAQSSDFPLKNSLQAFDAQGDAFVAKIAAGGGSLDFSTFFGGTGNNTGSAIALDASGNIYITGTTSAPDFPTRLPLQATLNNLYSGTTPFVTEFKADGSDYIFSTYLGGSYSNTEETNYSNGIAVDAASNIYVVGQSVDFDFPTVTPFQAALNTQSGNAFVAKIEPATPAGPQLFPAALNFGSVASGTQSSPQVVTLANGTDVLEVSSIVVSGPNAADFSDFSTCGQTVPPTVTCTFTVTFTPSTNAAEAATVTINESSGAQVFSLSGAGTGTTPPPPGTVSFNPTSLTFGNQEVGTESTAQFFTVTVTSTNPVTLSGFTTMGADPNDFFAFAAGTSPCPIGTPMASGTSCQVAVIFDPTAAGTRTATIEATGNLTGTPASLTATGIGTAQIASLTPFELSFPNQVVGTTSSAMTVTLTNVSSTGTLSGISHTISAGFTVTDTSCVASVTLTPGQSCTFSIVFSPTAVGSAYGELMVTDSDTGTSPQTAFLFGTGLNASATLAPIAPAYLAFGRQTAGTTSNAQYVFLQNTGNTSLVFTTPLSGTNPGAFQVSNLCAGTIAAGSFCEVGVTFAPPTGPGPFFATLTIQSAAAGAPQTVSLSGTGIPASTASLLPNPLVFPAIAVGQASSPEYAYLNNTGANADAISSITITGTDFEDFQLSYTGPGNTACSASGTLNAQAVCVVGVVFTPIATGLRTATLQVTDTATGTPHTIVLEGGTGAAALQITTTSPLPAATVGAGYSTTLTATGGTPSYMWGLVAGNLPPGLTLSVTGTISGLPTTAGTYNFTVEVVDSTTPTPFGYSAVFSLTVSAASGGIAFTSMTLPNGAVTVPYGADIQVTGGTQPYTFAVANGSTLPTGFTLDATSTGDAAAGHIRNTAPAAAGTFTFGITVTDSTPGTPMTGSATISLTIAPMPANTQPGLLTGQYAMLLRGFNELTGGEEGVTGSLTFDGKGNITSGVLDFNTVGTPGVVGGIAATGVYVIGADNRGVMSITPAGQTPGIFVFSVGNVYRGVASTVYLTSFTNTTGSGDLFAGVLRQQDPTSFTTAGFAGTHVFENSGQDAAGNREGELGLLTFNGTGNVTSGSADVNDNGTLTSITAITGSYTAPDSNGRSMLTLALTPTGPSSVVVYRISTNETIHMTLDPRASDGILSGGSLRQANPGVFSNTSLAGPDILSLAGTAGTQGTSGDIGLLTVTPGTTPTVNITLDTNDHGNLTTGQVLTGALAIAGSGRGTATVGENTLIFYLGQPDNGFAMTTDSSVSLGPIQPQIGAPFAAAPFANSNLFFGQQEAMPDHSSEFSGVATLGSENSLLATDDETHVGGNLFFDQLLGSFTYAVDATGHFTMTSTEQGNTTGYIVSPYQGVFMDTTGPASDPTPSARPHVVSLLSIAAPAGAPSPATVSVNFPNPVTVGMTAQSALITITNTGLGPLGFTGQDLSNSPDFSASGACLASTLVVIQPQGTCTLSVTFAPTANTAIGELLTETIGVTTDGGNITITASGTAAAANGPVVMLAPTSVAFGSLTVGQTSAASVVTLTNSGSATLTIDGITVTGTNSSDFAQTNNCGESLPEGYNCMISVTFKPTAAGARAGAISIADNAAGSPQTVPLSGTGASGPGTVTVTPGSLTFATQSLNTTSAAQSVTVTNTGTTSVAFSGFSITGGNSSDFALGSGANAGTCNPTGNLAASANCTINVTFTPTATGERGATLSIADDATGSPQTVGLGGTGTNALVTISVPSGGSTTATSTPGGTAYFGLVITGAPGVTGTVQLGCTPSSPTITCQVIPNTVTLNGTPVEVAFGIQTYCQGTTSTGFAPGVPGAPGGGIALLLMAMALGAAAWVMQRNRRVALTFAVLMLVALGTAACGSLAQGPNGATPAGTYTLTLSTTVNGQTQTLPNFLTLIVK